MRAKFLLLMAAIAVVACGALQAEAASRGRQGSPYVKTPWGWIPKSVYNAPFVRNPAKLEQYRQQEQQALQRQQGSGTKARPTTRKK